MKLTEGLHLPSSLTWDDEGNLFVVEAGGGLFPEQLAPMRILQIMPNGTQVEVVNLSDRGLKPSVVGIPWYNGWFYVTHRADDLTGDVSRVSKNGQVELLFKGIIDSQAEHQINDIKLGPDILMYVSVGPAGNAGVIEPSVAPHERLVIISRFSHTVFNIYIRFHFSDMELLLCNNCHFLDTLQSNTYYLF
ncbi:hypothetical protein [Gillisia limnaea]|uniref:hypothetical protein n=1 Tax=Gillisia limnaea TaxID=195907 RepID=UPI00058F7D68|nr:hypothetical protein [Gillisia limnaea]